jgi:hypothetical protein
MTLSSPTLSVLKGPHIALTSDQHQLLIIRRPCRRLDATLNTSDDIDLGLSAMARLW